MMAAESELTVAWGWVLVGTALSQVIGAPIAAGGWHCALIARDYFHSRGISLQSMQVKGINACLCQAPASTLSGTCGKGRHSIKAGFTVPR